MKIAISQWRGRISPVFDVSGEVLLVDMEGREILEIKRVALSHGNPFTRAREMVTLGTQLLLCGAISLEYEKILIHSGIHVVGFCCGQVDAVLAALRKGQFGEKRFRMPGFNGQKVCFGAKPFVAMGNSIGQEDRRQSQSESNRARGRRRGAMLDRKV